MSQLGLPSHYYFLAVLKDSKSAEVYRNLSYQMLIYIL